MPAPFKSIAFSLLVGLVAVATPAAAQQERERMRDDRRYESSRDELRMDRDSRRAEREERRRSERRLRPGEEERVRQAVERFGFRDIEDIRARPRHIELTASNRRGDRFEIELDREDYEIRKLERED